MTVSQMQEAYQQLREQMLRGELDEAEFKAEVEQLRFEDDLGNQWKLGWYTGKWYRYDQGQWVQDVPPEQQAPIPPPRVGGGPSAEEGRKQRSLTPCLVIALIGLLVVASIALILGWNTDWWAKPTDEATALAEIAATETALPTPSDTPQPPTPSRASPTSLRQATAMPSRTPSPTATRRPSTASPSPTAPPQTSSPTAAVVATTSSPVEATPTAVVTQKPSPTKTPSLSGSIYFPVYDAKPDRRTFDIHVFRLDSGKREVAVGQASQPALSPNGKRLAYRSWNTGQRGILVREMADGNTWLWISFHEAERPSWSPDNQNLVLSSQQESDRKWRLYRTWGLELDRVRREGGDIFGRAPFWSADGRIIYWECPLDKCGLYAIHTDGTNLTRLTVNEHDTAPAVSPGGDRVAFMSSVSGNWEIYVTSAYPSGGEPAEPLRLTQTAARDGLPAWSPDGRWLAFVTDREGPWAVWVTRPDGSDQRKLFDLGGPLEGEVANVPSQEQHGWTWERLSWGR